MFFAGVIACKHNDEDEFTFNGLDDSYSIERFRVLTIPTNASGGLHGALMTQLSPKIQNLNLSVQRQMPIL
jgi:hypothetical protein